MPLLIAIPIVILFFTFSDWKTRIQIMLVIIGPCLWVWGLLEVVGNASDDNIVTFFVLYILLTIVAIVVAIVRWIRAFDKSQKEELEARKIQRELDREANRIHWKAQEEEERRLREERKIEDDLFDNDLEEWFRRFGNK